MKTKIYVRIGKNKNGRLSVVGGSRPSYDSLKSPPHNGTVSVLPTLAFAVELDFPEALLTQAEQVAAKINLEKKNVTVCGTVLAANSES